MTKTADWTAERTATLLEIYDTDRTVETVAEAMETLGRSRQSIVGKLVSEGVYTAPEKPAPKPRDEGPTKKEMLAAIEATGFDTVGFDGATKPALARLLTRLSE
jgi:hypothetical protein|tara:strand:- start:56 stop:367 length:312 start_codon:yes stop_codon:yes gene_type:complete